MSIYAVLALAALLAVGLWWPRQGLLGIGRRLLANRRRVRAEDALKHVLAWQQHEKAASLESLAGGLQVSPGIALETAADLERSGCIESDADGIRLTPRGERRALRVVRAHRLWERYLYDDANMPLNRLHHAAEQAEHNLTPDQVSRLDAHLGHPQHDPHGDPIPGEDASVPRMEGVSLASWPVGQLARIAHVEDEPDAVFRRIMDAGVRPGQTVEVLQSGADHLTLMLEGERQDLGRTVAASVQVVPVQAGEPLPERSLRLSDLAVGEHAEVVELGSECHGFSRRRLLDLGLTPGTGIEVALDPAFGDPRAFRVRGTTVALRMQQTRQVWIRRTTNGTEAGI